MPQPSAWDSKKLSPATLLAIQFTAFGKEVYNPRKPAQVGVITDVMTSQLLPIWQFCEARDVTTTSGLEFAPSEVRRLLGVQSLRPLIMRYLYKRKINPVGASNQQVRVFADEEEKKEMKRYHPRSIEILKQFLGPIKPPLCSGRLMLPAATAVSPPASCSSTTGK